jgi:hypothetical protein
MRVLEYGLPGAAKNTGDESRLLVIPGGAISAFTRVCDALWREPGIQRPTGLIVVLDSGLARFTRAPE